MFRMSLPMWNRNRNHQVVKVASWLQVAAAQGEWVAFVMVAQVCHRFCLSVSHRACLCHALPSVGIRFAFLNRGLPWVGLRFPKGAFGFRIALCLRFAFGLPSFCISASWFAHGLPSVFMWFAFGFLRLLFGLLFCIADCLRFVSGLP